MKDIQQVSHAGPEIWVGDPTPASLAIS